MCKESFLCMICKEEFLIWSNAGGTCPNCGQGYDYQAENTIMLDDEQLSWLQGLCESKGVKVKYD